MKIGDKVWVKREQKIGFIYDIMNPHLLSSYYENETLFKISVGGRTIICKANELTEYAEVKSERS